MPTLNNPSLVIPLDGKDPANVTSSVYVDLSTVEELAAKYGLINFNLDAKLYGSDSGIRGDDDVLFSFPSQKVITDGTYTFEAPISFGILNEDTFGGADEIYSVLNLTSEPTILPVNSINLFATSPEVVGQFGS